MMLKRIKKVFVLMAWLAIANSAWCQSYFNKTYNYTNNASTGISIIAESNGTYSSIAFNFDLGSIIFVRLNALGDTLFTKSYFPDGIFYGTGYGKVFYDILPSGYFIAGVLVDSVTNKVFLMKFDNDGDSIMGKTISLGIDSDALCSSQLSNKDFILAGSINDSSSSKRALLLMKVDQNGNLVWEKRYFKTSNYRALSVQETPDHGFIIGAEYYGSGFRTPYVIKTDSLGVIEWEKSYGPSGVHFGAIVINMKTSGYLMTTSFQSGNATGKNSYVAKLDDTGSIIWDTLLNDTISLDNFIPTQVHELPDGSIVLLEKFEIWFPRLTKLSSTGELIWQRFFYAPNPIISEAIDFDVCPDGGFIVTGDAIGTSSMQDMWYIKLDSMGCDSIGCHLIGIPESLELNNFTLYPNPGTNKIQLKGDFNFPLQVQMYSLNGQVLLSAEMKKGKESIDTSQLPRGMYFIRIEDRKGKVGFGKWIRE